MTIETTDFKLAHQERHKLAEGAIFNPRDERFYYVDIEGFKIFAFNPRTSELKQVADAGEHIGGLAINQDGSLIVARKSGLYYFKDQEWLKVSDIEPEIPGNRPNDTAVVECSDGSVRFFVGTM